VTTHVTVKDRLRIVALLVAVSETLLVTVKGRLNGLVLVDHMHAAQTRFMTNAYTEKTSKISCREQELVKGLTSRRLSITCESVQLTPYSCTACA
jgi:hypothetical protein